jgi:hypothetical protein
MSSFDEYKAACFAYADEKWPGWEHRLNCDTLYMGDGELCVAGQLSGGNTYAWENARDATHRLRPVSDLCLWVSKKAVPIWRAEQERRLTDVVAPDDEPTEPVHVYGQKNKERLTQVASLLRAAKLVKDRDVSDYCIDAALRIAEGK